MRPLFTLIPVLGALVVACGPSAAETELLARIEALRAQGKLPSGEVEDAPRVAAFFEHFHELDGRLEEGASAREDRAALDAFQRAAAGLLDMEVCRDALRSGESLARPLEDTPKLMVMREWTQRFCARARLAAGEPDGSPAAIESLRMAFELLSVLNDGSLIGMVVTLSQEQWLIETLREIAPAVDATALRAALEPHLRARSRDALAQTVALETATFLRAIESVLRTGTRLPDEDLEVFGFADVGLVAGANRLIDRYEGFLALAEPCSDAQKGWRLAYAVREWHEHNLRLERARIDLALEAYEQEHGEWRADLAALDGDSPEPPCEHLAALRLTVDRP